MTLGSHDSLSFLAALALAAPSTAQSSLLVVDSLGAPDADFTTIEAAVAAAPDGATLLVRPGSYGTMEVTGKSLTVVGQPRPQSPVELGGFRIHDIDAGDRVLVVGLDVLSSETQKTVVASSAGVVWIEDCNVFGLGASGSFPNIVGPFSALTAEDCSALVVVGGSLFGGGGTNSTVGRPGLDLDGTTAALWSFRTRGGTGGTSDNTIAGGPGGAGIVSVDSFVFAQGLFSAGGAGGYADQSLICVFAGNGGPGISLSSGSTLVSRDSLFVGGAGGGSDCGGSFDGSPGFPGDHLAVEYPAPTTSLSVASVAPAGAPLTFRLTGEPGQLAAFVVGSTPAALHAPALQGTIALGNVLVSKLFLTDPATGVVELGFTTSGILSPATALTVFAQGAVFETGGGSPLLSPPTSVTVYRLP